MNQNTPPTDIPTPRPPRRPTPLLVRPRRRLCVVLPQCLALRPSSLPPQRNTVRCRVADTPQCVGAAVRDAGNHRAASPSHAATAPRLYGARFTEKAEAGPPNHPGPWHTEGKITFDGGVSTH